MKSTQDTYSYLPFEVDKIQFIVPMEYVGFILSTAEPLPFCRLPHMPAHVCCVVKIQKELISIIELANMGRGRSSDDGIKAFQRPFILVLRWNGRLIGLLADRIDSPIQIPEAYAQKDGAGQDGSGIFEQNGESFLLFDVPNFHKHCSVKKGSGAA